MTVKSYGLELFTQSDPFEAAKEARSNVFANVMWLPEELLHARASNYKLKVLLGLNLKYRLFVELMHTFKGKLEQKRK